MPKRKQKKGKKREASWERAAREVERLLYAQRPKIDYEVERHSDYIVLRFAPAHSPTVHVGAIFGKDFASMHARLGPRKGQTRREPNWNSNPPCANFDHKAMLPIVLHNVRLILSHKVRFRTTTFLRLPLAYHFEFFDSGKWRSVPR